MATGRFIWRCLLGFGVFLSAGAKLAAAQPLSEWDRVEAVQQRAWKKAGSFALAPTLSAGLNDPFLLKGGAGLRFSYWPRSLLGLAIEGGVLAQTPTASSKTAQRELRARMRPGGSGHLLLASMELAAVDGKVAVGRWIVPFELYLRGGAGIAGSGEDFFSEPGAAFAAGTGIRWFARQRLGVETALVWRSNPVVKEIAGRRSTDRDLVLALEFSLPFRLRAASESLRLPPNVQSSALSSTDFSLPESAFESPARKAIVNANFAGEKGAPLTADFREEGRGGNSAESHMEPQGSEAEGELSEDSGEIDPGNLAEVLPTPSMRFEGAVPLHQPVAPLPPGQPEWELSLLGAGGLVDPFWSKIALNASLRRQLGWMALEAFGGGFFSWSNPALSICSQSSSCQNSSKDELNATPGRLMWMSGAGASLRAAEGKVSLGGLGASWFSFHLGLGLAAVGYRVDDGASAHRIGPGSRLSLALQSSLGSHLDARLELSHLLYASQIRSRWGAESQLLLGAGVAWRLGGAR